MHRLKKVQKEESLLNKYSKWNVLMWMSGHVIEIPYHSFWHNFLDGLGEHWIF